MEYNSRYLIGNGRLITRDQANPYFEKGAVLVENSFIKEVGFDVEMRRKYQDVKYLDADGMVIMPGLINAHSHIYSAFARGLNIPGNHPSNFLEILEGTWWKIDRNLNHERTYYSAVATYLESIRNGITTVVDHHASFCEISGSLNMIAEAAKLFGIRTCLSYEISNRDGAEKTNLAVLENMNFIHSISNNQSNMLKALIGLHASFTLSDETLNLCKEINKYENGFHIHIAESSYDNSNCYEKYGCSVVERLYKKGILGNKTIAGHCIHISDSDMDILKETNTAVVHNPESNMANSVGCPDVLKMIDKGILVGLGTDGYSNDMFESVKVANILQKHNSKNPDRGFLEAGNMLFENNSTIVSEMFGEKIGIIQEGAVADIIIVDYMPYSPMNENNLNGHIIFGMQGALTDTTIINGKVLMRNKKILIENQIQLLEKCREVSAKLWSDLYE